MGELAIRHRRKYPGLCAKMSASIFRDQSHRLPAAI